MPQHRDSSRYAPRVGFFENAFNNGRIELTAISEDQMFTAVIRAAAQCRFAVQNADRQSGFVSLRARSTYKHWDGNLSVTVTGTREGAAATIAGALEGWSLVPGATSASRGEMSVAQGKLDTHIRREAARLLSNNSSTPATSVQRGGHSTSQFRAAFALGHTRERLGIDMPQDVADMIVADTRLLEAWFAWWSKKQPHKTGRVAAATTDIPGRTPSRHVAAGTSDRASAASSESSVKISDFRAQLGSEAGRRSMGLDLTGEQALLIATKESETVRWFNWWLRSRPDEMGVIVRFEQAER